MKRKKDYLCVKAISKDGASDEIVVKLKSYDFVNRRFIFTLYDDDFELYYSNIRLSLYIWIFDRIMNNSEILFTFEGFHWGNFKDADLSIGSFIDMLLGQLLSFSVDNIARELEKQFNDEVK